MIDQRPIQPNYLDLIPMKNFNQKETEATRKTNKEATANKENNENNQMGIYWCKQLATELTDKFKDREQDLQEV